VRCLLLVVAALLLSAASWPVSQGPILRCPTFEAGPACRAVDRTKVRLDAPQTILARNVTVDPEALPLVNPPMVWVIAMASSEVRWNGVTIGRNGVPGPDRSSERPGRFVAAFVVPHRLVRPGENSVTVRMSAHHLWLPVRTPVHEFKVTPYQTPALPGLRDYLPALLMLGALVAAFFYFAAAFASDRTDRKPLLLAAIALAATLQLIVEVGRAFVSYTYPLQLARVSAIAVLAAITAILAAAYAARRFAPQWRGPAVALTAAGCAASLVFVPWYDGKALGAIVAGALALAICAGRGWRRQRLPAAIAMASAVAIGLLVSGPGPPFLDQTYYLVAAVLLMALVCEQALGFRRARADRDEQANRAAALAERLSRAEQAGEPIVSLKDGTRTRRVAESDILYIRAADDYCDVTLTDGRGLLVTMTLGRLLPTLPERFIRVHRSYAVNRAHVVGAAPRPSGGRELVLSQGSTVPVGRAYAAATAGWIG
jgi:hypothetical protein